MANKEHLALLRQGVDTWNWWRQDNLEIEPNLSGSNLSSSNFSGANFSSTDLSDANLKGVNLSSADLSSSNLSSADLSSSNLSGADLSDSDLTDSNLSNTNCRKVNLIGSNLDNANLSNANLSNADLSGSDFSNADLSGADLSDSDLTDSNISNTDCTTVNLIGANLNNADLSGSDLGSIDLSGSNLSNADLSSSNLSAANLNHAHLSGSNLRAANLNDADLSDVNLSYVDLSNSNLSYANLSNVDLSGSNLSAAVLTHANLRGTLFSEQTTIDKKWRLIQMIVSVSGVSEDFSDSDLSYADLSNSDLSYANLSDANLSNTNFSGSVLSSSNLSRADLSGSNLRGSILIASQLLGSNLTSATLTGACIQDWNTNSTTQLEDVRCEYIYRKGNWSGQEEKCLLSDRRPNDPNRIFAPGEFTKLFQKALETVDLIFADGIDWEAFFQSFQELRSEHGDDNLSIQAIEKKSGGWFVIRLEVAPELDKAAIENQAKELYERKCQILEAQYRARLNAKDEQIKIHKQQSADLLEVVKLQASRPINVEARAVIESQSNSDTFNTDLRGANVANYANKVQDNATQVASNFSQAIGQNLSAITQLIAALRETAQSFPVEHREGALGHLDDLQEDLSQPERQEPSRIKRRLKALVAIALTLGTMAAGTVDFTNNLTDLAEKLGVPIELSQSQTLPQLPSMDDR